jgi:glycosyltransferase involved in cell wall biosynthesis
VGRYYLAAGLEDGKTHVIYNGVDLGRFQPRPPTGYLHRELGLPPDARLIGTIGQICLRKGQDVLVQAATALADRIPDAHYLIVGRRNSQKQESVDFEARLHRATRQGPLAGRLHLVGERDDIDRLLNELALLVHPARQEPLGRVLLEAAAAGVAVVATAVGGTDEIFPLPSSSARLVARDCPSALAEVMAGLLDDDRARRALGQAARARAESAFGLDLAGAALVAQYAAVAGARRHG